MFKKFLLVVLATLIAGDAVLLHGRYRLRMEQEAANIDYTVRAEDWSSPLVGE